jgi:peptidoglycan hydrolase CwlO-like protein
MGITLTQMQPELEKASDETEKLMAKLTVDKASAEEVQKVVSVEKKEADEQKAEASKLAA